MLALDSDRLVGHDVHENLKSAQNTLANQMTSAKT